MTQHPQGAVCVACDCKVVRMLSAFIVAKALVDRKATTEELIANAHCRADRDKIKGEAMPLDTAVAQVVLEEVTNWRLAGQTEYSAPVLRPAKIVSSPKLKAAKPKASVSVQNLRKVAPPQPLPFCQEPVKAESPSLRRLNFEEEWQLVVLALRHGHCTIKQCRIVGSATLGIMLDFAEDPMIPEYFTFESRTAIDALKVAAFMRDLKKRQELLRQAYVAERDSLLQKAAA